MVPAVAGRAYARISDWGLEIGDWGVVSWSPRLRDALTRGLGN